MSRDHIALALAHVHCRFEYRYRLIITSGGLENLGECHKHLALLEEVIRLGEKVDGLPGESLSDLVVLPSRENWPRRRSG